MFFIIRPRVTLSLGYEGPTDSCLCVSFLDRTREFLIESDPWVLIANAAHSARDREWPVVLSPADPEFLDAMRTLNWPRDGSDRE